MPDYLGIRNQSCQPSARRIQRLKITLKLNFMLTATLRFSVAHPYCIPTYRFDTFVLRDHTICSCKVIICFETINSYAKETFYFIIIAKFTNSTSSSVAQCS